MMHAVLFPHSHSHTHTNTNMHSHTHTCTYTHIYIYIHTHTNTTHTSAHTCIQVEEMEEAAGRIGKTIGKLSREVKTWPALFWIKETVEAFKKTMPLITDLRNSAMRQRHWEDLMVCVYYCTVCGVVCVRVCVCVCVCACVCVIVLYVGLCVCVCVS